MKENKKHKIKEVEQNIENKAANDVVDFQEKLQNNKFYYIIICFIVIFLIGLFLLLHFTDII